MKRVGSNEVTKQNNKQKKKKERIKSHKKRDVKHIR